jgi:hypothetical protein
MRDREPAALPLVGREAELHALDAVLGDVDEHGAALLVRGEVGIGKSSSLTYASARARARGMLTLRVTGAPSEAHLPFAGMHQLVRPILAGLSDLPDQQRDAPLAACGLIGAPAPDFFLIAMAALDLLAGAAVRAPLLVLVVDVQWLDQPTCDALAFIARRLECEPIVLLFALRDGFESTLTGANLPMLHLGGLAPAAAALLEDVLLVSPPAFVSGSWPMPRAIPSPSSSFQSRSLPNSWAGRRCRKCCRSPPGSNARSVRASCISRVSVA